MTILNIYKQEDQQFCNALLSLHDGDHFIGRETPIICNDKRISRKHARIVVNKSGAKLESVHVNPTFYKLNGVDNVKLLNEHDTVNLNDGDQFALLIDTSWFKVKIMCEHVPEKALCGSDTPCKRSHEEDVTQCSKRLKEGPESNQTSQSGIIVNQPTKTLINVVSKDFLYHGTPSEPDTNNNATNETLTSSIRVGPIEETNLSLPSDSTQSLNSPVNVYVPIYENVEPVEVENINEPVTCIKTEKFEDSTNLNTDPNSTRNNIKTESVDEEIIMPVPKMEIKTENSGTSANEYSDYSATITGTVIKAEIPDEEITMPVPMIEVKTEPCENSTAVDNCNVQTNSTNVTFNSNSVMDNQNTATTADNCNVETNSTNVTFNSNSVRENQNTARDRCWYTTECYRKNPQHTQKYSHPGDSDYGNDDRPVCSYGYSCYRRNNLHRRQYRHFAKPAPKPDNVNGYPSCDPFGRKPGYERDCDGPEPPPMC